MKTLRRKRVPSLWWDYTYEAGTQFVVVETDDPKRPVVAKWRVPTPSHSQLLVERAMQLIADIDAGRKTLKEAAAEFHTKHAPGYLERLKIARRALKEATSRTQRRRTG